MMVVGLLIQILVMAAIVYAIVAAVRRRSDSLIVRSGELSLRRLFVYAMLLASLIVAGIGLSEVLGAALSTAAARRELDLAGPLAMMVVGLPVFGALALWVRRTHASDPSERSTAAWTLYLNGALLVTLGAAVGSAFAVAGSVIDGESSAAAAASLVVWGAAWAGHWYSWDRLRPTLLPRLHLWIGSAAGLWIGAGALFFLIHELVQRAIDPAVAAVGSTWANNLQLALWGVAIGGAVWTWHWLVHGVRAPRTEGWHGYVLLPGVLAGLAAVVTGAGLGLYLVLEWLLGDPGAATAPDHFRDLSFAVAAMVVGLGSWRYHRAVVGPSATRARTEVDRIYDYLVSGVALVTVAVAVSILVVAFFEAIAPLAAQGGGAGTNTLLAATTLLLVGVPMWAVSWRRVQRLAAENEHERRSITRRTYMYAIFGVGGAVAFVAMIGLLVVVFEALLDEGVGNALVRELDVPVALLVTTGAAALYHWLVYRAERHVVARSPRRDVLLVGDGVDTDEIAQRSHVRVRVLHRMDVPAGPALDVDAIVAAIDHAAGDHLLVLAGPDDIRVVPYE